MSQIDSVYVENYISLKSEIVYFKLLTLLLTHRFGYNEELNYPLSDKELNIETLRLKSSDIDNKISLEHCVMIASKLLNNIDNEYDEFIEDIEDTNIREGDVAESLEFYNKLYYDMLDTAYKNNMTIKKIFNEMLSESLAEAIKEEDYESASIINNKISQINS